MEGQYVMEKTNSLTFFSSSINKSSLTKTCMAVFYIRSVPGTISAMLSLPKPSTNHRGPQFNKHCRRYTVNNKSRYGYEAAVSRLYHASSCWTKY
jgi:hypothetical protein